MIKNFLNPRGHENPITGSRVTAILLKGRILPIGGASGGEGLRLQPAQQACSDTKQHVEFIGRSYNHCVFVCLFLLS